MTAASAATAAVFVWLGMFVAISFVEAPLKFRAPGPGHDNVHAPGPGFCQFC